MRVPGDITPDIRIVDILKIYASAARVPRNNRFSL